MNQNIAAALRLAAAGLYVLPCNPNTKWPRLMKWPALATNQANGIRYYWEKYGFDSMPGIAAGKSGLVVIDLDVKNGIDGCAGFDALGGEIPPCPVTRTPSGGFHLVFKQPQGRRPLTNSSGALPLGIDVRGVGGQFIAPGAVKSDGTFYESVSGWPDLAEAYAAGTIPVIPEWLAAIIDAEQPARDVTSGADQPRAAGDKSAWAAEGLRRAAEELAATPEGGGRKKGRNNLTYEFVCTFAGHARNGWTTREEVYAAAHWACEQNGYLASNAANDGPRQFEKTFESAWRWGFAHPTHGPRETVISNPIILKPRAA